MAENIHTLYWGRLIQGCGLAACAALWRSIVRDAYPSSKAMAQVGGYLSCCFTAAVMIGPFIGGWLQHYVNWHANFLALLLWTIVVIGCVVFILQESHTASSKHRFTLRFLVQSYGELIRNRLFMTFSAISFFSYGGLLAWLTSGPVIIIHQLGFSPAVFGCLLLLSGLSTGLGGVAGSRMAQHHPLLRSFITGLGLMILAGLVIVTSHLTIGDNIYSIMISAILYAFGSTLIFLNCFALGFEDVGHIAGYASSLYASIQLLGGVVSTWLMAHISSHDSLPMGLMFILSGGISILVYGASVCFADHQVSGDQQH
jgi:predicted MFS family arabinose efflux permease